MDVLPFLVRMSHIAGPVVALLLCGVGVVAVRRVLRRDEQRRARALRTTMGSPVEELVQGDHVLEGVLEGTHERLLDGGSGVASTARVPDGRGSAEPRSSRASDLRLRIGDASLRVDGPVEVLLGAQRTARGGGFWARLFGPSAMVEGLRDGDPVWVWAGVRAIPTDGDEGPTSYREGAQRWMLHAPSEPLPGQSEGTLGLATAGVPRPPRRGRHVAVGVALGFSAFAGLTGLAATGAGQVEPGQVASWAEQIAVLSPVYRDAVGARVVGRLARGPASDDRREALDEAVALFDVCGEGPQALAEHGLLARAASEAARCRNWYDAGTYAFAAGSFGEASAHWARAPRLAATPLRAGVIAMTLSGDAEGAARLTESELDAGWGVLRGRDPVSDQCLRDALRRHAHRAPTREAVSSPTDPLPCRLIHATARARAPVALDELVAALVQGDGATPEERSSRTLAIVWRWAEGIAPRGAAEVIPLSPELDGNLLSPPPSLLFVPHLLDAALAQGPSGPDAVARRYERAGHAHVGALRAKVAFALGAPARAREHAVAAWRRARALPDDEPALRAARVHAATTHALLSLLARETVDEDVWSSAHPDALVARRLAEGTPEGLEVDPRVAAIVTGPGARKLRGTGRMPPLLPFVTPHDEERRDTLRTHLASGPSWPEFRPDEELASYLGRLALFGAHLERLDAPGAAAGVVAVGQRFAAAFERRPRAAELLAIASVE